MAFSYADSQERFRILSVIEVLMLVPNAGGIVSSAFNVLTMYTRRLLRTARIQSGLHSEVVR